MSAIYTVDYFLRKFEAIPDDKWCVGEYVDDDGKKCALGLCGCTEVMSTVLGHSYEEHTTESHSLIHLFLTNGLPPVATVNDSRMRFTQETPKQRILAALRYIKEKQKT